MDDAAFYFFTALLFYGCYRIMKWRVENSPHFNAPYDPEDRSDD